MTPARKELTVNIERGPAYMDEDIDAYSLATATRREGRFLLMRILQQKDLAQAGASAR